MNKDTSYYTLSLHNEKVTNDGDNSNLIKKKNKLLRFAQITFGHEI